MESYEKPFPRQVCPACGGGIDRSTDLEDRGQSLAVGDVAICHHCGAILECLPGLRLRAPAEEEVRRRCSPGYFRQLLEIQQAVRTGGQLKVVSNGDPEEREVESIQPTDGRRNRDHDRN